MSFPRVKDNPSVDRVPAALCEHFANALRVDRDFDHFNPETILIPFCVLPALRHRFPLRHETSDRFSESVSHHKKLCHAISSLTRQTGAKKQ
jgi:hypothetical protein